MKKKSPLAVYVRFILFAFVAIILFLLPVSRALAQTTDEYFTKAGESVDLADHYLTSGQPEKAINLYQAVLKYFPGVPLLHMELARIYKSVEKWKKALKHTRIAQELEPLDNNIASEYGKLCLITGDPKDAVRVFQELLERDPEYPGAEEDLLEASMRSKKWETAIPILQKKINADPSDDKTRMMLTECYIGVKVWNKAIDECGKILAAGPDNIKALWTLARLYRDTRQAGPARETLEEISEKHPGDRKAQRAIRNFNAWMTRGSTEGKSASFISTVNPGIQRRRGLVTLFRPQAADEQVTYDFYCQRKRNKKTGERSRSIYHDAEFNTVLNEHLQLNLDFSTRQDENNEGVTPILGWNFQYNWSDALDFQFTAGFEPHRGANRQFSFEEELDWWPINDFEFKFCDTQTRYWDSNFSNSASIQGTYHAHRFIRGLRFRFGGYHDMIERPSDYYTSIEGHAKPLMLWTGQFDVEKDFQLPLGILLTCGYSFGYDSNNTIYHTGYGGLQRHIGENIFIFGSFSGGIDSDDNEYLGAGAYAGINFKF